MPLLFRVVSQFENEAPTPAPSDEPFFLVDEVAMLRFMAMCQTSYTPDLWEAFEKACRILIQCRPGGLRADCFERIEAYLSGKKGDWDKLGHSVLES